VRAEARFDASWAPTVLPDITDPDLFFRRALD
jgi:hypothetical protein